MPCWYYDKEELKKTLSIQDGIDYEMECRYRREGARLILDIGAQMNLGYITVATGAVFFHRFYMFHSFKDFPRYVTACTALFLAGKVEETPKKCNDILKTARGLLSKENFQTFGENPKEEVVTLEKVLIHTIKYDLQVDHPYQFLSKYAKCLRGNKKSLEKLVQMAWTFVNDSLCTTLCVQWEPEIIAIALIHLAAKINKFHIVNWSGRTPAHKYWWDMYVEDINVPFLEDICHQVLDLYNDIAEAGTPASSPPVSPATPH